MSGWPAVATPLTGGGDRSGNLPCAAREAVRAPSVKSRNDAPGDLIASNQSRNQSRSRRQARPGAPEREGAGQAIGVRRDKPGHDRAERLWLNSRRNVDRPERVTSNRHEPVLRPPFSKPRLYAISSLYLIGYNVRNAASDHVVTDIGSVVEPLFRRRPAGGAASQHDSNEDARARRKVSGRVHPAGCQKTHGDLGHAPQRALLDHRHLSVERRDPPAADQAWHSRRRKRR